MTYQHDEERQDTDQDDDMVEFWAESGMPAAMTIRFNYTDSKGESSERTVDVRLFAETAWGDQLIGRCRTRNAERTFSLDRISNCIELGSGKAVSDVYEHLHSAYRKTPEYSFDRLIEEQLDTLRAAMYMADFSGLTQEEKTRITLQLCRQISGDSRISETPVNKLLASYSSNRAEGIDQTFRLISGRLSKSPSDKQKQKVLALCAKIATLKGPVSKNAQDAIDYMANRFAANK